MLFQRFFENKTVLVTGDTGFKGSWLSFWLRHLGAKVYGMGLEPETEPSLFEILRLADTIEHETTDIRDKDKVRDHIKKIRPQIIFHLAAQALVRRSYEIPLETLETNVLGTANILDALRDVGYDRSRPCIAIIITSDKCYENMETMHAYTEDDPMGGFDIYSMSKGAAELLMSAYRRSFFQNEKDVLPSIYLASCRSGNVIGGGDWNTDRIVVDCIEALTRGSSLAIRNPGAIRPWQHVLEPLYGYLLLAWQLHKCSEKFQTYCTAWNFGPGDESEKSVGELCDLIIKNWGHGKWIRVPDEGHLHEANYLKLSNRKALELLGWRPAWDFDRTMKHTVDWYRIAYENQFDSDLLIKFTLEQIEKYTASIPNQPRFRANASAEVKRKL